jgi:hypothetical protein
VAAVDPAASAYSPDPDNFKLLAGFTVLAQAIERLIAQARPLLRKLLDPGGDGAATERGNTAIVTFALSTLLGVLAAAGFGLYFLDAVTGGQNDIPRRWDVLVSGLLIAGGTASLHELISRIEKTKQAAAAQIARTSTAGS